MPYKTEKLEVLWRNDETGDVYKNEGELIEEGENGDSISMFTRVRTGRISEIRSIAYDNS
jgi:hypothetical protein